MRTCTPEARYITGSPQPDQSHVDPTKEHTATGAQDNSKEIRNNVLIFFSTEKRGGDFV